MQHEDRSRYPPNSQRTDTNKQQLNTEIREQCNVILIYTTTAVDLNSWFAGFYLSASEAGWRAVKCVRHPPLQPEHFSLLAPTVVVQ